MEQDKVVHEMEGEQVSSAIIDALQYKNNNPNNPSPVTQPQPQQQPQEEVEAGMKRLWKEVDIDSYYLIIIIII